MAMKNVLCVMVLLAVSPLGTLGRATGEEIVKQITSDDLSTMMALKSYLKYIYSKEFGGAEPIIMYEPFNVTGTLEYRSEKDEILYDLEYKHILSMVCGEKDKICKYQAKIFGPVAVFCGAKFVDSAKGVPRFTEINVTKCEKITVWNNTHSTDSSCL